MENYLAHFMNLTEHIWKIKQQLNLTFKNAKKT